MVTFAQLRDAKPAQFQAVADDLLAAAKDSEESANAIHANGRRKLEDSWKDELGAAVRDSLATAADKFDVMAILNRSAAAALDTLQDAVELAQRELTSAVSYATANSLTVDENGTVNLPPTVAAGDLARLQSVQTEAQSLITDAVEAATQADGLAEQSMTSLRVDPDTTSQDSARAKQSDAVEASIAMLRDTLPHGQSPEAVERWWNGLSDNQRTTLENAVPIDVYDLPGIPASVRTSLEANENGYNRIAFLKYARDHVNDESIDVFDNNCANYVSNGLLSAGLDEKGTFTTDDDGWGRSAAGDWNWKTPDLPGIPSVQGISHTDSWYNANAQREFFQNNGGATVSAKDAQPGDVAYWNYNDGPGGEPDGESHHAAIVTSVLPDGEAVYSQHTPSAENYSVQGRLPEGEQSEGDQDVVFVRPRQGW
ncbi:amidase domain-containing protein [Williamsia sp. MIQD14]|uniref:amidase domain-containing protein n=1 Tax=Williamsia sp. MIQD14 TaxID=3425703 RepID=UPI003DA1AE70